DPRAIELVRAANPKAPAPEFLSGGPPGARLCCALDLERDLAQAVELVAGEYWNEDVSPEAIARAHRASPAWVGAHDEGGRLIATGRACSGRERVAYLMEIAVAARWRGRGLGKAIVRLLLDHPQVRDARRVMLRTRDAQGFYRGFGFVAGRELPGTEMTRVR